MAGLFFLFAPISLHAFFIVDFFFNFTALQSTVAGQVGVDGPRAANPVELALNNVFEHAITRGHIMEDDIVLGQAGEIICATHNRALVGNKAH